jgi:hypothetical protein
VVRCSHRAWGIRLAAEDEERIANLKFEISEGKNDADVFFGGSGAYNPATMRSGGVAVVTETEEPEQKQIPHHRSPKSGDRVRNDTLSTELRRAWKQNT